MVDKLKPNMNPALLTNDNFKLGPNCPATKPLPIPWMAIDLGQLYKITSAGMVAGKAASEWRLGPRCTWWRHQWKQFPRYWPFVRGFHRSPVKSPHKGQWRGTLMFSLICTRINGWVNNSDAGDLRRHRFHYDVTVMSGTWLYQDWQILQKLIWWAPLEWKCHDMISVEYHSASHCLKTFSDTIKHTLNYYSRHQWIEIEFTNPQSTCPKFAYFCSEWCIVGRETSALWDLWEWSIVELV